MHYKTLETRITDYHELVITITKTSFNKGKPNIINYRCYKHFDENKFKQELSFQLQTFSRLNNNLQYSNFLEIYQYLLNKYAPIKKKVVRANEAPFMTNELRKAIMIISRLNNVLNLNLKKKRRKV